MSDNTLFVIAISHIPYFKGFMELARASNADVGVHVTRSALYLCFRSCGGKTTNSAIVRASDVSGYILNLPRGYKGEIMFAIQPLDIITATKNNKEKDNGFVLVGEGDPDNFRLSIRHFNTKTQTAADASSTIKLSKVTKFYLAFPDETTDPQAIVGAETFSETMGSLTQSKSSIIEMALGKKGGVHIRGKIADGTVAHQAFFRDEVALQATPPSKRSDGSYSMIHKGIPACLSKLRNICPSGSVVKVYYEPNNLFRVESPFGSYGIFSSLYDMIEEEAADE